jgi:hypothetical protein
MPYERDIIHYFFYFAPFKPFLSENLQFFKFGKFCRETISYVPKEIRD